MVRPRGFTLVELLLVVTVLGLIAALAIPRIAHSGEDAKRTACAANIRLINAQIEVWTVTNGGVYPEEGGGEFEEATARRISKISRYYKGRYPADHSEFEEKILNNTDLFPDGPPECPYGLSYEYDASRNRVKPHDH